MSALRLSPDGRVRRVVRVGEGACSMRSGSNSAGSYRCSMFCHLDDLHRSWLGFVVHGPGHAQDPRQVTGVIQLPAALCGCPSDGRLEAAEQGFSLRLVLWCFDVHWFIEKPVGM